MDVYIESLPHTIEIFDTSLRPITQNKWVFRNSVKESDNTEKMLKPRSRTEDEYVRAVHWPILSKSVNDTVRTWIAIGVWQLMEDGKLPVQCQSLP